MSNPKTYEQTLAEHGFLVYTTSGRSMRPFIRSGEDLVHIRAKGSERFHKYDVVLYRRRSGLYVLHRIVKVREKDYVLCGDNCWQREPGVTDDQILGVLTGILRKGKQLDVEAPAYRRRVRLWCALYYPRAVIIYFRDKMRAVWTKLKAIIKRS